MNAFYFNGLEPRGNSLVQTQSLQRPEGLTRPSGGTGGVRNLRLVGVVALLIALLASHGQADVVSYRLPGLEGEYGRDSRHFVSASIPGQMLFSEIQSVRLRLHGTSTAGLVQSPDGAEMLPVYSYIRYSVDGFWNNSRFGGHAGFGGTTDWSGYSFITEQHDGLLLNRSECGSCISTAIFISNSLDFEVIVPRSSYNPIGIVLGAQPAVTDWYIQSPPFIDLASDNRIKMLFGGTALQYPSLDYIPLISTTLLYPTLSITEAYLDVLGVTIPEPSVAGLLLGMAGLGAVTRVGRRQSIEKLDGDADHSESLRLVESAAQRIKANRGLWMPGSHWRQAVEWRKCWLTGIAFLFCALLATSSRADVVSYRLPALEGEYGKDSPHFVSASIPGQMPFSAIYGVRFRFYGFSTAGLVRSPDGAEEHEVYPYINPAAWGFQQDPRIGNSPVSFWLDGWESYNFIAPQSIGLILSRAYCVECLYVSPLVYRTFDGEAIMSRGVFQPEGFTSPFVDWFLHKPSFIDLPTDNGIYLRVGGTAIAYPSPSEPEGILSQTLIYPTLAITEAYLDVLGVTIPEPSVSGLLLGLFGLGAMARAGRRPGFG